tara:strand:- start:1868 stop:2446 length:579 start_codon:yes stop_codon:yes gene_type:complete
MPRIKDIESGLWHTPTASGISPTYEKRAGKGKTEHSTLREQVIYPKPQQMWPTPNAWDAQRGPRSQDNLRTKKHQINLITAVKDAQSENPVKMWPTPRGSAAMSEKTETVKKRVDKRGFLGAKLEERVAMWPTPKSAKGMHFKLTENMEKLHHKKYLETEVAYRDKPRGGHLNPEWVEWLMGFPIKWTDLKD